MPKQRILVVEDDPDIGELEKCILEGEGLANVKFMDGGIVAWPYDVVMGKPA